MFIKLSSLVVAVVVTVSILSAGESPMTDADLARLAISALEKRKIDADVAKVVEPLNKRINELEKEAVQAKADGASERAKGLEKEIAGLQSATERLSAEFLRVALLEASARAKFEDSGEFRQLEREAGYSEGKAEAQGQTIKALSGIIDRNYALAESAVKNPPMPSAPVAEQAPSVAPQGAAGNGGEVRSAGNGVWIVDGRPCRLVNGQYVVLSGSARFWRMRAGCKEYWTGNGWGASAVSSSDGPSRNDRDSCYKHHRAGCHDCGFGVKAGGGAGFHLNVLGLVKLGAGAHGGAHVGN